MITIAICDDDYKTTQILWDCVRETALAEQNLEINIICFKKGETLCQCAEIQQINILLLDIEMPELNGIHTDEQFREVNPICGFDLYNRTLRMYAGMFSCPDF